MTSLGELKAQLLQDPKVKTEYEALAEEFETLQAQAPTPPCEDPETSQGRE